MMLGLTVTPRPSREEEEDTPRSGGGRLTARWVGGYRSAEEQFFEETLRRLAEVEREFSPPSHLLPTA